MLHSNATVHIKNWLLQLQVCMPFCKGTQVTKVSFISAHDHHIHHHNYFLSTWGKLGANSRLDINTGKTWLYNISVVSYKVGQVNWDQGKGLKLHSHQIRHCGETGSPLIHLNVGSAFNLQRWGHCKITLSEKLKRRINIWRNANRRDAKVAKNVTADPELYNPATRAQRK